MRNAASDLNWGNPVSKSDTELDDDVSLAADNMGIQEGSIDHDPLAESVKKLRLAQLRFETEVQKCREVGEDGPITSDDPMHEILELKYAKILELECRLNSGNVYTELEDRLMRIIETEVEYVVITTTTKILTECLIQEVKHDVQKKFASLQEKQDLNKLQDRVCKLGSCFIIMLVLLLVTLYLKFPPQNVVAVPT